MAAEQKTTYPSLPNKQWWQLRKKLLSTVPSSISTSFIATALGIQSASAKNNIITPMIALGFIDAGGKPTDRLYNWRNDTTYPEVCKEVFEAIYPEDLRIALPGPNPDMESVVNWFSSYAKVGTSAARKMANTYVLLAQADPTKQDEAGNNGNGTSKKTSKVSTPQKKSNSKSTVKSNPSVTSAAKENNNPPIIGETFSPKIHIDFQIHIAPDTSPEQIDKIFESMSKHLYKMKENA